MENKKIADTEFRRLAGHWKTEGVLLKTDESPEMKISGTDTYELIIDGFYLVHNADVLMGEEKKRSYEIIGVDINSDKAFFDFFDDKGYSGRMSGIIKDHTLKITGDELRFSGFFSNSDTKIEGSWEKINDENEWSVFLEMTLTKTS